MAAELHGATVLDAQDVELERLATFVQLAWARGYSDEEVELYTEVLQEEGCLPSDEDKARVAGLLSPFHIARLEGECAVPPLPFPVDRCYTLVMY
jgi:hypothetical protein